MRIAFDARMIDHPGIGRYIKNLLNAIIESPHCPEIVLYGDLQKLNTFTELKIRKFTAGIYTLRNAVGNPFAEFKPDIIHIPHFNAPFRKINNLVITIHDLIYLKFPHPRTFPNECSVKEWGVSLSILNALKQAKSVIAVSNYTKNDIVDLMPQAANKTKVIYEGIDPIFMKISNKETLEALTKKYSLPESFFLFVGSLKTHKNIEGLINAYLDLQKKGVKDRLVIVGRFRPRESRILKNIKTTNALYLGEIPTSDLAVIYNLANLLVMPSFYEGFGLPVLEAFASGTPVVSSNTTSLPEVIGNPDALFNPYNYQEISNKILQALNNADFRNSLIEKGYKQLEKFSWKKAAQETLDLYKENAKS